MSQTEIFLILFLAVIAVIGVVVVLRRKPDGTTTAHTPEGHGVGSSAAAAIEDVVDQFLGVDSHPALPEASGPADPLTQIKGLGPKAQAQLDTIGIRRFDQLAALDEAQVNAVDLGMGAFKGRILKDQWVEQARHLAAGDTAGFEAKFGKLGG